MRYDNNDKNKIRRKKISSSNTKPTVSSSRSSSNKSTRTNIKANSSKPKRVSKSQKKDKFKIFRTVGVSLLVLGVLGVAVSTALVFVALKDVDPITKASLDKKVNTVTELLYSDGTLMGNPPTENKKIPISIKDMPTHLQHALVSIEDQRFYKHNGVDAKGLIKAFIINVFTSSSPGGSTLDMQVSKNLLTSSEVSIIRKIKDIYYALEMDKTLNKNQILELYLNSAYFGRGAIGVEAASNAYFNKHAKDLTVAESAMIVGITQNPNKYAAYNTAKLSGYEDKDELKGKLKFYSKTDSFDDPTTSELNMIDKLYDWDLIPDPDTFRELKKGNMVCRKVALNPNAKNRQETVLKKMLELGYLTQQEHDNAIAEKINIQIPKISKKPASSVEDLIESNIINNLIAQGYSDTEANTLYFNGGLKIRTTIDKHMQSNLESEFNNRANFPGTEIGSDGIPQPQAAMVILDYRTGKIKALIGGREIKARKVLNRATEPHQPGSTIKPLSVYTPAIDSGMNQANTFNDSRGGYKFKENNKWNPKTTTSGYGSMTMRKALAYSSNTIAIKVAEQLGSTYAESIDIMVDYLKNFGLSDLEAGPGGEDRKFSSLTLGGMRRGASPLDMAAAYGTLANGGVYIEPITFTTVESSDGQVLIQKTPEEHKVVDPEVAYVLTDMLKSVITEGIGGAASFGDMPVAGKTGTTNDNNDAWFVGYTPYYVGSTYIGDDYRLDPVTKDKIRRRGVIHGSSTSAKLWSRVMNKVHEGLSPIKFKSPHKIEYYNIDLLNGSIVPKGYGNSGTAAFIKGHTPSNASYSQQTKPEETKPEATEIKPQENPNPEGNVNNNTNNIGNENGEVNINNTEGNSNQGIGNNETTTIPQSHQNPQPSNQSNTNAPGA